ncbi:MAG: hypothetical protein OEW15_11315 [Nitrospirota bacterium]|nr:hypothetical protein [Nitrospirota bacterium]
MTIRRLFAVGSCAVLLAVICSCGRKTDPLVPDSPRPEAVRDLAVTTRDTEAYLSWSVPGRNIEGKPLLPGELALFRVFRAEIDRENRRPRYKQVAEIETREPAPAVIRDGTVLWTDREIQYNRVYAYRVRAFTANGGTSEYSNDVRAVPLPALAIPGNPAVRAGDGAIEIAWDVVNTRTNGAPYHGFVGYNIYRGTEAGHPGDVPLNREPVSTNSYRDTAVENGRTYYYRVRAVDSPVHPWRESQDSEEASAAPRDMTPPEQPMGLTVVPGIGRVFLTWNENKERDLAGYNVYRTVKSGAEAIPLTDKPVNRTTYSDDTVQPAMTYYYRITAVDRSGNESVPSREFKTYTEKIR